MPKQRKPTVDLAAAEPSDPLSIIARLMGVLAVRDIPQQIDKVVLLRSVGFDVRQVAAMLGISENGVSALAYQARKKSAKAR